MYICQRGKMFCCFLSGFVSFREMIQVFASLDNKHCTTCRDQKNETTGMVPPVETSVKLFYFYTLQFGRLEAASVRFAVE